MLKFVNVYLWAFALATVSLYQRTWVDNCLEEPTLSKDFSQVFGIEPPLPGYRVEVLQWEVPVSRDGRTAILNGTVQQVYQQLLEVNPNYEAEFGSIEGKYTPELSRTYGSSEVLERQDTWSDCGRFDAAKAVPIWEGINHLNHVSGTPVSNPGPGMCGRVSCSYNSAIWWCNDVSCDVSSGFYHLTSSAPTSHSFLTWLLTSNFKTGNHRKNTFIVPRDC